MTMDEMRYFGMRGAVDEELLKNYREVPKELLVSIIERTEKAVDEEGKSSHLTTLVDAITSISSADYRSAFLLSWLVIDNLCQTQYFLAKGISYSESFQLAKASSESPKSVFKSVAELGYFDKSKSDALSELYVLRNKIVHPRGYVPKRQEAAKCFGEAKELVRKELGFYI